MNTPSELTDAPVSESTFRPLALALAVAAGLLRLFPHPWNLTPMGAVSLFGGARLRGWQGFAVPLGLIALTDLFLWYDRGDRPFDPFVYAGFAACVLLGRALAHTRSPWKVAGAAVAGAALFFLVTNFGAWLAMPDRYPRTLGGLAQSYLAAIPFARGTFLGDLIYTPLLFAAHELLARVCSPAEGVRPQAVGR